MQETVCNLGVGAKIEGRVGCTTSPQSECLQWAQSFTTGEVASGYVLYSVQIPFNTTVGNPGPISVAIHEQAADGSVSDTIVGMFPQGGNPSSDMLHPFLASQSGITLKSRTTYFVVLSAPMAPSGSNYYALSFTNSAAQTGSTGWSIGDESYVKRDSGDFTLVENAILSHAIIADFVSLRLKLRVFLESALP